MASLHVEAGIQVVILARGTSRKLDLLTESTPKPLLPVANRPLLSYQISELQAIGINSLFFASPTTNTSHHTRNNLKHMKHHRVYDRMHGGRHSCGAAVFGRLGRHRVAEL